MFTILNIGRDTQRQGQRQTDRQTDKHKAEKQKQGSKQTREEGERESQRARDRNTDKGRDRMTTDRETDRHTNRQRQKKERVRRQETEHLHGYQKMNTYGRNKYSLQISCACTSQTGWDFPFCVSYGLGMSSTDIVECSGKCWKVLEVTKPLWWPLEQRVIQIDVTWADCTAFNKEVRLFTWFPHTSLRRQRICRDENFVWNSLPHEIRHIQSATAFKTALKTLLFKSYLC